MMKKKLFIIFMLTALGTGCAQVRELKQLARSPEQNLKLIVGALTTYEEMLVDEAVLKLEIEAFNKEYMKADEIKREVMVIGARELNGRLRSLNNLKLTLLHAIMVELKRIKKGMADDGDELE